LSAFRVGTRERERERERESERDRERERESNSRPLDGKVAGAAEMVKHIRVQLQNLSRRFSW
jgi:hypothetical protein